VKVGTTTNPRARLASLRTGSAFPIDCSYIAVTPGDSGAEIERAAHTLLDRHRLNGEWFGAAPELAVAALNAAAYMIGQPLLQVTLDNCDRILRIASGAVHLPPEGDGYLFESLPGIIKWPLAHRDRLDLRRDPLRRPVAVDHYLHSLTPSSADRNCC
jgi:hypothetical protein